MTGMLGDLRLAARMLVKHPGVTAIAVVALALGIGTTTTMFSIVNGALFKGLPFPEGDRIMHLERTNLSAGVESMAVPIHDYLDWRERQRSFKELAAYYSGTVNVSGTERAERYDGAFISANGFAPVGVQPVLGRTFREGEDSPGAAPVAIIGHRLWQDRFGGDPGVIGAVIRANGEQTTIVGVMPEGFVFPENNQIWLPIRIDPVATPRGQGTWLEVYGRLEDGLTPDQAVMDLTTVTRQLEVEYPETNEGVGPLMQPFVEEFIGDEPRQILLFMLGATFFVLIVACANVANLLLARAAVQVRDVAIRTAMGASRGRIVSQMVLEALALSLVGAVAGLGLAWLGVHLFTNAVEPTDPPFWLDFSMDLTVFGFVFGVALLAALFSGLIPALQATGADINAVLKDESRGSSGLRIGRLSKGLVMIEVAFSVALLAGAGLMIKSVSNLRTVDMGFDPTDVFTARVGLFEADYPDVESRRRFWDDLLERLNGLPGVEAAALATALPGGGSGSTPFAIEGVTYATDQDYPFTRTVVATPGFFETFRMPTVQGRGIGREDGPEALDVTVVNEAFAARFFPGEDVLGRRIRAGRSEPDNENPWLTIVGVAPNTYLGGFGGDDENPPGAYLPLAQSDARFLSIAVRTRGVPMELAQPVRDLVTSLDRDLPIYWVRSMDEALAQNTWFYRVFGALFAAFGVAALFLASVGLYGVMAFSVSRRTQEVGIRMALGAEASDVIRLILRQGFVQLAVGLALGLVLALLLSQGLQILLFQVAPRDPAILATITLVLLGTGLAATLIPARRATKVDPMVAFRYE